MSKLCIDAKDLKIHFPLKSGMFQKKRVLKAVDGVSFSIEAGSTMGLVGESGCGKTTVGRSLLRLYEIQEGGQIIFDGADISRFTDQQMMPYRKRMQMIFQDPYTSLDPRKTVAGIVSEPLLAMNIMKGKDAQDRVREMVELVGLKADHLSRYPHEFSGGQRQRIGIARALVANPEFIVCDEPISALDVSIQAQVINILEELQDKFGFTYLFISHDLSMVRHISHQVGVMYLGNLIEYAEVDELYENMVHPYTKCLMSAVPAADPVQNRERQRIILQGDVPSPIDPPSGCPFRTRCKYCMDICAEKKPELVRVNEKHMVACHLAGK
ncbi:MAG: ATP-binding cassette domain-containing protein [Lachnospiraceae bacterium]|nr:ATP-binding cassette domain-containing protein [Lachnospiraceae bacterium]